MKSTGTEKERYKKLCEEKNTECRKLGRQFELVWRDIGKLEAKTEQVISQGKLISSLLQVHLSRKRRYEKPVDENVYLYCDRWWNFLPAGSGVSLPFRGPIRVS